MPPLKAPTLPLLRSFSTTTASQKSHNPLSLSRMPPYPYGPAQHYKQSNSGLYGGSTIQFGNQVSSKNAIKTRRAWRPNIHQKRLWSDALQKFISVKIQARVLRTIDKVGGLDEYLLGDKPARIRELGVEGWRLRWKVLRSESVKKRWGEERKGLGLPVRGYVSKISTGDGVEKEVERVKGKIVENLTRDAVEDELASEDEPANMLEASPLHETAGADETMEERVARTARNIERSHGRPSRKERSQDRDPSEAREVPHRLVGIRERGSQGDIIDDQGSKQAESEKVQPDVVQANDSRSLFSKLKGILRI